MENSEEQTIFVIYKVTAPNGKIYIGQTRQGLDRRKRDHFYLAKRSSSLFAKTLKKYKNRLQWEIIEENITDQRSANEREIFWIRHFKSNDKKYGYNLTEGGHSGKLNEESERKRILAVRKALKNNPKISKKSSDTAKANWQNKREEITKAIKSARSTPESRALTSKISKERIRTKESSNNISKALKLHYQDESNREKTSKALKKAKYKPFAVFKEGLKIAEYHNQCSASEELGVSQPNMSAVLAGRRKSAGGYVFRYISESNDPQTRGGCDESGPES